MTLMYTSFLPRAAGGNRKREREAPAGTDRSAAAAAGGGGGGAERPAQVVRRDSGAGAAAGKNEPLGAVLDLDALCDRKGEGLSASVDGIWRRLN